MFDFVSPGADIWEAFPPPVVSLTSLSRKFKWFRLWSHSLHFGRHLSLKEYIHSFIRLGPELVQESTKRTGSLEIIATNHCLFFEDSYVYLTALQLYYFFRDQRSLSTLFSVALRGALLHSLTPFSSR